MRSSSQLFLLCLLKFIVLCFGQQNTSSVETQYEYYTPKDEKDIWDSKLNGIVQKNGDQWNLDLNGAASNEPLNIVLFMDKTHPLNFTLVADDLNAIAPYTVANQIYLSLENDAKEIKEIMVQWQGETVWKKQSVIMKVFIGNERKEVGTLDPLNSTTPRFFVDYEGTVTVELEGAKESFESNQTLLPTGQSSANFTLSITWIDLQSSFSISFASSIFGARRPLPPPPPPSTTSTSAPLGSSTEVASANNTWIIVVGCIVGVLVIVGVAFGIWYYRKKRSNRMKSYVETIPIGSAK